MKTFKVETTPTLMNDHLESKPYEANVNHPFSDMFTCVNGYFPDKNGRVDVRHAFISIIDGSAFVPGMINKNTVASVRDMQLWLRASDCYSTIVERIIMTADGRSVVRRHTGHESIGQNDDGSYNLKVYFGDDLAPIIFDAVNDKLILDPDWVAPTAEVTN